MKTHCLIASLAIIALVIPALAEEHDGCALTMTTDGGFWEGKGFHATRTFTGIDEAATLKAIARHLARDGWQSVTSDAATGIVTASTTVSHGQGAVAPLSFVVDAVADGVKVEASFSTTRGQVASEDDVRKQFCDTFAAVAEAATKTGGAK